MNTWAFTFDGITGRAEAYPAGAYAAGVFITWGGMAFHLDGAGDDLRAAILAAKPL